MNATEVQQLYTLENGSPLIVKSRRTGRAMKIQTDAHGQQVLWLNNGDCSVRCKVRVEDVAHMLTCDSSKAQCEAHPTLPPDANNALLPLQGTNRWLLRAGELMLAALFLWGMYVRVLPPGVVLACC
jgi:hypothetical protein